MKRTVYLILFRGVGGKTQLPVQKLREKLTKAGFENAATYINSGNAIVRSRMNRKQVISTIAELCRKHFKFDKAIFAPTLKEWEIVITNNPFPKAATTAPPYRDLIWQGRAATLPTLIHVSDKPSSPEVRSKTREVRTASE